MKSLPQRLHDRAELLARSHDLQTVAQLLRLHPSQITRMKKRGWQSPPSGRRKRPMPGDFAVQSRIMSNRELSAHYGAGFTTIQRWLAELPGARGSLRGVNLRGRTSKVAEA